MNDGIYHYFMYYFTIQNGWGNYLHRNGQHMWKAQDCEGYRKLGPKELSTWS